MRPWLSRSWLHLRQTRTWQPGIKTRKASRRAGLGITAYCRLQTNRDGH
uniref:Uncharacterized protein n=1 Tax=uncultured Vibrionales bacterium HF0010_22E23 TaxID=710999 RepID=E0XRH3_9GAMM|nr:hypothetical protein [uncultured Vibrionales bacterium HF0010_22E23]